MKRGTLEALSVASLLLSLLAVCDMLVRLESPVLVTLDLICGVACIVGSAVSLLVGSVRRSVHQLCAEKLRLLPLRLGIAVALLLLGWYVNGASEALYGADSPMLADNGIRLFCQIFTMVLHVVLLGFRRRELEEEPKNPTRHL